MAAQIRVIAFDMEWNEAQRQGNVGLKFSDGREVKYRVNSLADLAGWAALLKEVRVSPNLGQKNGLSLRALQRPN